MTEEEEKEVIRVCGPNYEESDIPAYIRNRDKRIREYESRVFEKIAEAFGMLKKDIERYNPFQRSSK